MNPNKALWEKGDFTRIAGSMRESGEALVTTLGITDGLEVLDLGCGDGTTALPAAKSSACSDSRCRAKPTGPCMCPPRQSILSMRAARR